MKHRPAYLRTLQRIGAVMLLALLQACAQPAGLIPGPALEPTPPSPAATPHPTAVPSATPTDAPPPTLTAKPTAIPSVTPSPAPPPLLTLHVPESWRDMAETAVAAANSGPAGTLYQWQVSTSAASDARLEQDGAGLVVGRTPLALAVPFTTDWEEVSLAEAEAIQAGGHELVQVQPWHELDSRLKALRIDGYGPADASYPLQETWSLVAGAAAVDAAAALLPYLREAWPQPPVHLLAVGDIMLDRSLGYALERGDLAYPFTAVAQALQAADVTVGNVESALGDVGEPAPKRYPFRAPPAAAGALQMAGFDVVSLANNHAMDYGPEALLQGIDLLGEAGVQTAGAGPDSASARAPAIVHRGGLDVAFLAYVNVPVEAIGGFDTASWTAGQDAPGLAWAEPAHIRADVAAIREEVDLVVVLLHSGFEYQAAPSDPQREAAYAAIDGGADLVIGHHAHILQGIEWYGDGVIAYGTGNFAFDIDGDPETALFHFWLDRDGVREIAIEPALVQFGGQPRLAEPWLAPPIRWQVYALTDALN